MIEPRPKTELTLEEKLAGASPAEHRVTICVNGKLVNEIERLDAELVEARKSVETMADQGNLRRTAERIEELRAEMSRFEVTFVLRGLSRPANNELKAQHPPRPGNDDDRRQGFNQDTFFVPLVRACMVEPELTEVQYEHMVNNVSDGEFTKLALGAFSATEGGVTVPFSSAASSVLRSSGETSKPQSA